MSQIKSKNTKPELLVRKLLHSAGFRFKLHVKTLPGKPDIVLPKYKTVIFVNGCFWHGHANCNGFKLPKTRSDWWLHKINKNIFNDQKSIQSLHHLGWNIKIVWDCELKIKFLEETLVRLVKELRNKDL